MKTNSRYLLIPILLLLSCYSEIFYWGDYTDTLYAYKKEPNEKTLAEHLEELQDIIEESHDLGLKVPPGIYCEYAYFMMQKDQPEEAMRYIQLEEEAYPESKVFTDRLRIALTRNPAPSRQKGNVTDSLSAGGQQ
jgi:hypothetical protein